MTRAVTLPLFAGVLLGLVGCQSAPKPSSGLAALRVKVIAEPKVGAPADESHVSVYDSPAEHPTGAFERVDYSDLEDIVVWLEPAQPPALAESAPAADANLEVDPGHPRAGSVVAVCVGQRIEFHNSGAKAGGIYSVSDGNDFSLGPVPPGGRASYVVRSAGPIEVLTDPARDPLAEAYAAPSRWAFSTRSGKQLTFNNIPPGRYRLVSWHPRLPGSQVVVTLSANQVADATIKVGVNELPKVNGK